MSRTRLSSGARVKRPPLQQANCTQCGLPILIGRLDYAVMADCGWDRPMVTLHPSQFPGGAFRVSPSGLLVRASGYGYDTHKCLYRVTPCKYCGVPVRVLRQPPGAPEQLAVVDANEDPTGILAFSREGYIVHDPGCAVTGPRFRWHTKHINPRRVG